MIVVASLALVALGAAASYARAVRRDGHSVSEMAVQAACILGLWFMTDQYARLAASAILGTLLGEAMARGVTWRRRRASGGESAARS